MPPSDFALDFSAARAFWDGFSTGTLIRVFTMFNVNTLMLNQPSKRSSRCKMTPASGGWSIGLERFRAKATGSFTLVLDSPGVRLDEAFKIINFVVSPPAGVQIDGAYLPENAQCHSARPLYTPRFFCRFDAGPLPLAN